MELRVAESAHFVTLTYSNENLPMINQYSSQYVSTLNSQDLTLFLKRLRKRILKDYEENERWTKKSEKSSKWSSKLRYFACGEYGGNNNRPHYHIALYNCPIDYIRNDPIYGGQYSKVLEEVWNKGIVDVGKLERGSAHYMTKYHMFPHDDRWTESDKRQKPFARMSRKPGIGINFIDDTIRDYFTGSKVGYYNFKDGSKIPIGRYYKDKLDEIFEDEEVVREIKNKLKKYASEQEKKRIDTYRDQRNQLQAERNEVAESKRKLKRLLKKKGKL